MPKAATIDEPIVTIFESESGAAMKIVEIGSGDLDLIWAHGWGQSHDAFIPIVEGLAGNYRHLLLDFPGFAGLPPPPTPWGTENYRDLVAEWINHLPRKRRIWIGHSFGCRVGIRVASRNDCLLDGLFLIAAAGIRPPTTIPKKITRSFRGVAFRTLKRLAPSEEAREALRNRWGSDDYRTAGAMRRTFVKVVNEDLSGSAKKVLVPVRLIYGERDTDTPVVIGKIFESLIPNSRLEIVPRFGHLDILTDGRFQMQARIKGFVRDIST